jgi:hypothetical protein
METEKEGFVGALGATNSAVDPSTVLEALDKIK